MEEVRRGVGGEGRTALVVRGHACVRARTVFVGFDSGVDARKATSCVRRAVTVPTEFTSDDHSAGPAASHTAIESLSDPFLGLRLQWTPPRFYANVTN